MRFVAVGISHHTAPVELRERLALSQERVPQVLAMLRAEGLSREGILLSTCNRVELYAVPEAKVEPDRLAALLADATGTAMRLVDGHLYRYQEQEALRHVFRVVSSLDSMVVGEPQIVGQVRDAYRLAQAHKAVGPVLHQVMDRALQVAKRVRNETDIGREAVSVGRAGVELARQVLGGLEGRAALLIGAGAHGKLVARALLDYGLGELVVANRTFQRAVELANKFGGSAIHQDDVPRYLERVDIVLASTAAGQLLVTRADVAPVMKRRRYRSLVMIDLSVPRNIATDVNELEGVYRFDVDDLSKVAESGKEKRLVAAESAERIVMEEVRSCWKALDSEVLGLGIRRLTRHADEVRLGELERNRAILDRLDAKDRESIEAMTRSIVKKLLHEPLGYLRRSAGEGRVEAVDDVLRALLGSALTPPVEADATPADEEMGTEKEGKSS
jgi:glutamyl-tRNA reductase